MPELDTDQLAAAIDSHGDAIDAAADQAAAQLDAQRAQADLARSMSDDAQLATVAVDPDPAGRPDPDQWTPPADDQPGAGPAGDAAAGPDPAHPDNAG